MFPLLISMALAGDDVSVQIGGYVQPRFTFVPEDESAETLGDIGFSVPKARPELKAEWKLPGGGFGGADLKLSSGLTFDIGPETKLQDAWVLVSPSPYLTLRGGQQKTPVGRSQLNSDRRQLFPDRAEIASMVPKRDIGAMASSRPLDGKLEIQAGLFNGEGTNKEANENQKFLSAWRVSFTPVGQDEPMSEYFRPADPTVVSVGYSGYRNIVGEEDAEETRSAHSAEVFVHYKVLNFQSEVLASQHAFDGGSGDYSDFGAYAQASCFLPPISKRLAVLARWEQVDAFKPEDDVPLAGPTDPAQQHMNVAAGLGFYAAKDRPKPIQEGRVLLTYTAKIEQEGEEYDNNELVLATHFGF